MQALNEYRISGDYIKNYPNAVSTIARCSRSSEMFVSMSTVSLVFRFNADLYGATSFFCQTGMDTLAGVGKPCGAPSSLNKYERYYGPGWECTQQL